jgi:hypothetical protein
MNVADGQLPFSIEDVLFGFAFGVFATALRPQIVGAALQRIAQDPEVLETMFEMLETQRLLEGEGRITLVPKGTGLLAPLLDAGVQRKA